tara:strand:- start:605 stop:1831 length:1227 start_codon:yes stop_codon:yes gene_type:complete
MKKKNYPLKIFWLLLITIFLGGYQTCAQCDNGFNFYPSSIYNPIPGAWGTASSCNWAGEVIQVNVISGDAYQFSTCSSYGGTSASYDTQLTLRDAAGALLAFNDDFFSCTGFTSYINWTATYTGTAYVHLNEYNCLNNMTCTRVMIYRTEVLGPGPCENATFYTSKDMPTFASPSETISCYYAGEYCRWDNAEGGVAYTVLSSVPTDWITVRFDAFNGPVDVVGTSPVIIQSAKPSASYYVHVNVDDLCKVESLCRDITVMRQSPLPIDLLSFTAELLLEMDPIVLLRWEIASQVNNDYYEIQRSVDVEDWTTIEKVTGAGNSNTHMSYSIIDDNPILGISYYRLKQTDYDGMFETFQPISMIISSTEKVIDKVYNLMGQEVEDTYEGIVIEIYQDGTSVKKYKLNQQ